MAVPPLLVPVRRLLGVITSSRDLTWTPHMAELFAGCAEQARLHLSGVSAEVQSAWRQLDALVVDEGLVTGNGTYGRDLVEALSRYNAFASLELCPVDPALDQRLEGKPWLFFRFDNPGEPPTNDQEEDSD